MVIPFYDKELVINPNRHINRKTIMTNLNGLSLNQIIKIFKDRINNFYLEKGIQILLVQHPHYDFILMVLNIITIDLLSQYEYGLYESDGNKFKSFLKSYIPEFDRSFKYSGFLNYYDRKSKCFSQKETNKDFKDYADAFWFGFRNGIVHNGMILPFGRINRSSKTSIIKEEIWDNKNNFIEITINPANLFVSVIKTFK